MKRLLLIVLFLAIAIPASGQYMAGGSGYKYHKEEFIFFNWNNREPVIYIFQVTTSFDGPRSVRFYRGWYSLNGKWSMFVDERIDNQQPGKSPLEDALKITRWENGERSVSFKYHDLDLGLKVLRKITSFEVEPETRSDNHSISIHHGQLTNKGTAIEGLIVHNYRFMGNHNPLITEGAVRKYGKFDLAYLFTEKGDVLISGYSEEFEHRNQSYFWLDKENGQSLSCAINWTSTFSDTVARLEYPTTWEIKMPGLARMANVDKIGSFLLVGDPETVPHVPNLYGLFTVMGQMTVGDKKIAVSGLINHFQD